MPTAAASVRGEFRPAGVEIGKMSRYEAGLGARLYREKGYISQPIPIATNRKAKKAHTA